MSLETLALGEALPAHHARAKMPAEVTENKIHEDGLARDLGFRGALVPGVTVYAWMTHPVVAALGTAWLERGSFRTRFATPVYFDEPIRIEASVTERPADAVTIEVRAVNAREETCATATFRLGPGPAPAAPHVADYPAAPLPAERPRVTREILAAQPILGTPEVLLDPPTIHAFLERVGESLALYSAPAAPAHPGLYLHEANKALSRNVVVSPWIHVESEGQQLGSARAGERLETRAKVGRLFEKKGHQFVELDLLQLADGVRPVARIRHTAIYQLRGVGG
jgi:hypothetical protein